MVYRFLCYRSMQTGLTFIFSLLLVDLGSPSIPTILYMLGFFCIFLKKLSFDITSIFYRHPLVEC